VYAKYAFGDYAGFLVGWMDWVSTAASVSAIAIVIGESVVTVLGWSPGRASTVAMAVVSVFTILLLRGSRLGDVAQRITSFAKALALVVFIAICLAFSGRAHAPAPPSTAPTAVGFTALLLAAQSVIYTYDGWSGPIYFSEEFDDPGSQIPRSMFYGLLTVAVIYLLINVVFVLALPVRAIAGSTLAAGTVAESMFGGRGDLLVRIVVIAALPSAVNACLLICSRVLYSVSRDGLGLPVATRVNPGGTPTVALALSGIVALAFLATGTFGSIIAIAAFFFVADYTLSFIAVFVLRAREPNAIRPYRAKGHPWTTGFVLIGSLAFLTSAVVADRRNSLFALGIVLVSYPVFRLSRRPSPTPAAARP
jgi:APA family basic amino acid/polyamine antiporter